MKQKLQDVAFATVAGAIWCGLLWVMMTGYTPFV